ncbi:MAG TPA: histidine--tRNA ligase [Nitrososphaerales archaeon]|nr:histidine--tRNA ligase [Nitrososphaerales archaeon]
MDLSLPRGVDDVEPQRYARQDVVRRAFEEVSKLYNFSVMEPASLEHLSTLRAKSGEDVDKEIYSFKDKGGRDLGLRFDLTVGITRYVCSRKDLRLPVKLAASGGIWRYDEPQYGRYRWSHQWDLEVFGQPSVIADAEVIDASASILRKSGLSDFTVKVGDRRVVEDYVRKQLGIGEPERIIELMRALDKVEKKTTAELLSEYTAKGFEAKQVDGVLDFGRLRGTPDEVLAKASEMKLESVSELRTLADDLDSRGLKNVEYNMSIVRGIDYYTGIVFEAADTKNPRLGSLFGGGRYDALPRIFGRPELSATGAAGGIERIAMSLGESEGSPGPVAYVAVAGTSASPYALRVQKELREAGVSCEASLVPKALSKQMEDASRLGAAWTIVIGEKEEKSQSVTLRNMKSGREELLHLADALKRVTAPERVA